MGVQNGEGSGEKSLSNVRVLADLDTAERLKLESRCKWRWCKPGQQLVEAGGPSREVFFIVEGRVNIVDVSESGREVVFAGLSAGDCFGELAALDGQPRSASVVASEKCLIATLDSGSFVELLRNRAEVTFKVLENLARMVRSSDTRIMELSTLAASQRVYAEMLRMCQPDAAGTGLWVVRPLPPLREIASRVSTTRETVARAMGQVYSSGLMKRKGRNLYLMDRAKLEDLIKQMKQEVDRKAMT